MLNELLTLAKRKKIYSEPGFINKPVQWVISIDHNSRILGIVPLGGENTNQGRKFERCPDLSQGELIGGGKQIRCHFLIETIEVVTGVVSSDDQTKKDKIAQKHKYFLYMLDKAKETMPEINIALKALENQDQINALQSKVLSDISKTKFTDKVTLRVEEKFLVESSEWHEWWRQFRSDLQVSKKSISMRCLLTGELVQPAEIHPKVKGLARVDGAATGDVLIGFDKESFKSFNLEKSTNAATDANTAKLYTDVLNHLIENQSIQLGNVIALYWFSHELPNPEDDMFAELENPSELAGQETRPKQLLEAVQSGQRPDLLHNFYHVWIVSGQAGRIMVRSWHQGTLENLLENIIGWFQDLEIVKNDGSNVEKTLKFYNALYSPYSPNHSSRTKSKVKVPAPITVELWRTALDKNKPIPSAVFTQALLKSRSAVINNKSQNHACMAILKAYHLRNKGDTNMCAKLNPKHPDAAYQCGRLLAVLSDLQYAALGDIGAGITQRYYTATSQTPALRIGQLISNSKNHLNKLQGGLQNIYQSKICEIMDKLTEIPKTLDLEKQSLFALGYYHQMADIRAHITENKAKKQSKQNEENYNGD